MSQVCERAQELADWLFDQQDVHSQLYKADPSRTNKGILAAYSRHCKHMHTFFGVTQGKRVDPSYIDQETLSAYIQLASTYAQEPGYKDIFPEIQADVETSGMILNRLHRTFPEQAEHPNAA